MRICRARRSVMEVENSRRSQSESVLPVHSSLSKPTALGDSSRITARIASVWCCVNRAGRPTGGFSCKPLSPFFLYACNQRRAERAETPVRRAASAYVNPRADNRVVNSRSEDREAGVLRNFFRRAAAMAGSVGIQSVTSPRMAKINFRRAKKNASRKGLASKIRPKITGGAGPRDHGSWA